MTIESWVPVVIALVAAIPGVLAFLSGRRKDAATAEGLHVDSLNRVIVALSGRVDDLQKRQDDVESALHQARIALEKAEGDLADTRSKLDAVERQNIRLRTAVQALTTGVRSLIEQVKKAGMVPTWIPDAGLLADIS